jgi:hypothetical protein
MENRSTIIIAVGLVVFAGLIGAWVFLVSPGQQQVSATPVTEVSDSAQIQNKVQLAHVSIATSENFARQKIYVISASLKNMSDMPLRMAEVKMVFTDTGGMPIHEYTQKVLEQHQKPLPPGNEFRFEVRQENLPRGWNYRIPIADVTKIGY